MSYTYSIDPSAPPVSKEEWDSCFLAKSSAHLTRRYSASFKRPIPNLGGGRLGIQGNMFVHKMYKLKYENEQTITISVSFTYNSPIFSLKIKVIFKYFFKNFPSILLFKRTQRRTIILFSSNRGVYLY